jgi:dCMP deaminase
MIDKDSHFMLIAERYSLKSRDPSRQVGCVVVSDGYVRAFGWNHFPDQIVETTEKWEKPAKHNYVIHAEIDTLRRLSLHDLIGDRVLYTTLSPCLECAKSILLYNIKEVVYKTFYDRETSIKGIALLEEAGVIVRKSETSKND